MGGFIEQVGFVFMMCSLIRLLLVIPSVRKLVASYFRDILRGRLGTVKTTFVQTLLSQKERKRGSKTRLRKQKWISTMVTEINMDLKYGHGNNYFRGILGGRPGDCEDDICSDIVVSWTPYNTCIQVFVYK